MTRSSLIALGAGIAFASLSTVASAGTCECAKRSGDPVWDLPHYKAAFAGRVQAVEDKDGVKQVSFQVVRAWKGGRGKQLTVATGPDACSFNFETGKDYVVFATADSAILRADTCGPTSEVASAGHTIRQLDMHAGYGNNPLKMPR
jgi:hypothetical protein